MTADIEISAGGASVRLSPRGAEPLSWCVGGRELLWNRDPAHWAFSAPILFPVVGSSSDGVVRVAGRAYPMPQHGFARRSDFTLVASAADGARFRLTDSDATHEHYPFRFALDVAFALASDSLHIAFAVTNRDGVDMPFAIGFHPAFLWPFDGGERRDYRVVFDDAEDTRIPGVTANGLLVPHGRTAPLAGATLPLDPAMFVEALVFLDARSRRMRFEAPSGAAIAMAVDGFPHLAVWSRPTAPFLSLEAWTGHADWDGFAGELSERASMRVLPPGETAHCSITLSWHPGSDSP